MGLAGPSEEVLKKFSTYLEELLKWQKAYSLTGLRSQREVVIKGFLDSALYLLALPEGPLGVLDVGSGAGFPALPMKLLRPELRLSLLEPSRKRAAFLRHIIFTLGLGDIQVLQQRLQELAPGEAFDVATTRALLSCGDFLSQAGPHLRPGGLLLLSKGPRYKDELEGLQARVIPVRLPLADLKRYLVVLKRP